MFRDWPSRIGLFLCFVNPVYSLGLSGDAPPDIGLIMLILSTILLGTWISMPQILLVYLMTVARQQPTKWALLALSVGAAVWVADVISYSFSTASSMATAHVMGPMYAVTVVGVGAAALFAAEWLWRRWR